MMHFLQKHAVGLDVADHTIEVVKLSSHGKEYVVSSLGRISLEPGIVVHGRIQDAEKLAQAIDTLFSSADPEPIEKQDIVFGMPDSQLYTHVVRFGKDVLGGKSRDFDERLEAALKEELLAVIPLREKQLSYSYKILQKEKEFVDVIGVAMDREAVLEWQLFFEQHDLKVELFDVEQFALRRSLLGKHVDLVTMVVDIGTNSTLVSVVGKQGLMRSFSVPYAGKYLSEYLARELQISPEEAEQKKRAEGVEGEGRVQTALQGACSVLLEEVTRTQSAIAKTFGAAIEKVVLAGGGSLMPGIADLVSSHSSISTELGVTGGVVFPEKHSGESLLYAEAVGLAMRHLDSRWDKSDPSVVVKGLNTESGTKHFTLKNVFQLKHTPVTVDTAHTAQSSKPGSHEATKNTAYEETLDDAQEKRASKLRKQKMTLGVVLVLGVGLIGGSFWYRATNDTGKPGSSLFAETQELPASFVLAFETGSYSPERLRAREVALEQTEPALYDDFVDVLEDLAAEELADGEVFVSFPLRVVDVTGTVVPEDSAFFEETAEVVSEDLFPVTVVWAAYFSAELDTLAIRAVEEYLPADATFLYEGVSLDSAGASSAGGLLEMSGVVRYSTTDARVGN